MGLLTLQPLISMNTSLCCREIAYTKPGYHKQNKSNRKYPEGISSGYFCIVGMHVDQIGRCCYECPNLFGISCPVVPPCLFSPYSTHKHTKHKKAKAYINKII